MEKRKELWRALPFVMALLLLTLVPAQSASALFGKGKEEAKAVDGAPVAENMEIKVYRGVAYEGEFRAVDNEGDEVTFAIAQEPKKGMVALTEDGLGFVYTPGGKLGTDSFTYTAIDAYGNISLPATVSVTIEKANCGVFYADMDGERAHTAAVDLVEHALWSTLATFALCAETDEQRACCVALEVVVGAVGYGREEELAARIFPNVAVVVRSHCAHALLSDAVVDEQLLAVVRHAHLHRGAVRESLSPAVVVYCHEADVRLVEHAAYICCTDRSGRNLLYF